MIKVITESLRQPGVARPGPRGWVTASMSRAKLSPCPQLQGTPSLLEGYSRLRQEVITFYSVDVDDERGQMLEVALWPF